MKVFSRRKFITMLATHSAVEQLEHSIVVNIWWRINQMSHCTSESKVFRSLKTTSNRNFLINFYFHHENYFTHRERKFHSWIEVQKNQTCGNIVYIFVQIKYDYFNISWTKCSVSSNYFKTEYSYPIHY